MDSINEPQLENGPISVMNHEAKQLMWSVLAGVFLVGGLISIVTFLTFEVLPSALNTSPNHRENIHWVPFVIGAIFTLIGCGFGYRMLIGMTSIDPFSKVGSAEKLQASNALFSRYLVGLGFALFVDATLNMIAFAGFAYTGKMKELFPLGDGSFVGLNPNDSGVINWMIHVLLQLQWFQGSDNPVILTVVLIISLGMAVLGALLFFSSSLWTKYKNKTELFDRNIFWAGLWFRLAEAITFTIALFLFCQFKGYDTGTKYLPMIGLFIGLTVKSSEALVFGLAERFLASITAFIHGSPKQPSSLVPPLPPSVTSPLQDSQQPSDVGKVANALCKKKANSTERRKLFNQAFEGLGSLEALAMEYEKHFKTGTIQQVKDRLENLWKLRIVEIKKNLEF